MKNVLSYISTVLISAGTTVVVGCLLINNQSFARNVAKQLIQNSKLSVQEELGDTSGYTSFPQGAEFGTDNILILDKEGNLNTEGIAKVGDLYVGGTAFIDSLNLADFLFIAGNKIIDSSGRIPALTIDYIASLDGSALSNVNADRLDGIDSTGFIKTGTAIDADKLDGKDSSEFITSGTAIDADKLDGIDSSSFLRSDAADIAGGALTFTAIPGSAGVGGGPLYINPTSSTADYTLLGIAVNGTEKFRVDAEGDVTMVGTLTATGGVSGTINPGFTTGSVIFQGATALSQDNTNFFWDDTNNRLGIGINTPLAELDLAGNASTSGTLSFRGLTDPKLKILNGETFGIQTSVGGDSGLTERLTILSNGNVGVGTTTPIHKLHVSGTSFGANALVALNETSGNNILVASNAGVLRFRIGNDGATSILSDSSSSLNVTTTGNTPVLRTSGFTQTVSIGSSTTGTAKLFVTGTVTSSPLLLLNETGSNDILDARSSNTTRFRISSTGGTFVDLPGAGTGNALCHASSAGVDNEEIVDCTSAPAADYMEMYPVESSADTGTVVAIGKSTVITKDGEMIKQLIKTTKEYQVNVIGIVSDKTKAGDFNSIGYNIEDKDNPQPVALAGRVPVKIASNSQEIKAGDFVTSSSEAGKAMKATHAGYVIGKALESWSPSSGKSTVMVFVNNSYYIGGDSTLDSGSFLSLNSSQDLSNGGSLTGSSNQTIITELQTMEGLSFDEESSTLSATSIFKTIEEFIAEGIATFKNTVKFLADVTFGGKVLFENKVEFNEQLSFKDKDLAGYAQIKSGSNEVKVTFGNEYVYAPVIQITPQGNYDIKYWVTDVSTKGFTIKIDPSLSEEVRFSWSALAVKDAKTYENNETSFSVNSTITNLTPSPTQSISSDESSVSAELDGSVATESTTIQE